MKKKEFENLMPDSQQYEISGLVQKCWNKLTTEEKQYFEEEAEGEKEKYRNEMKEYNAKYTFSVKKSDDISHLFIQKLKALQEAYVYCDAFEPLPEKNLGGEDIFTSVADQAISQILNLRKDSVKLIR
jgi:hypothetical protein